MRQSSIHVNEAGHAVDRRLIRQLIDLHLNFHLLQAPMQIWAEEQELPKVELIITRSYTSEHFLGATFAVIRGMRRDVQFERLQASILIQTGHERLKLFVVTHVRAEG